MTDRAPMLSADAEDDMDVRANRAMEQGHTTLLLTDSVARAKPKLWGRCVKVSAGVCCCLCFVMVLVLLFAPYDPRATLQRITGQDTYASDAYWRTHAERLRNYSDPSADPCIDFYQFACGGWIKSTRLLPGETSLGAFDEIQKEIAADLLEVVEQDWPYVGTWFTACTDQESRQRAGREAILPLLELAANVASKQQLAAALGELHASGVDALFSLGVVPDERQPTRPTLYIYYPAMGASRGTWQSNSTLAEAQRSALGEVMGVLLGSADLADEALSFERDWLAPATLMPDERRGRPMEWLDAASLPDHAFDWPTYWEHTLGTDNVPTQIGSWDLTYPVALDDALRSAPWHKVRSYLQYSILLAYADSLPNSSATLAPLRAATSGAGQRTITQECLASTSAAFPDLLGHYYVRRFFSPQSKVIATAIVRAVLDAMGERVANNQWMDVTTRTHALSKLSAIRPMVGYPDEWSSELPPFYVSTRDHLGNALEHQTAMTLLNWALITVDTLPDAPSWDMPVTVVNAYYDPLENDIVFPAAILEGGFFNEEAPLAANFGGIGAVGGHECSHSLDDEGRHYDADGARRDWWTPGSAAEFDRRARCVVDLYSSYETPYGPVNGNLTLGENLADIGGLVVSYQAYHDTLAKPETWTAAAAAGQPPTLEKYEANVRTIYHYPANQLFFREWAASWCSQRTPQRAAELLHEDPHSPSRWRVNGPASQSAEFAAAFNCPPPPPDACTMW